MADDECREIAESTLLIPIYRVINLFPTVSYMIVALFFSFESFL